MIKSLVEYMKNITYNDMDFKFAHQYGLEVTNNSNGQANIENTDTVSINAGSYINSLYPYYGQNTIPNNGMNNGTSCIWINYQRLIDAI